MGDLFRSPQSVALFEGIFELQEKMMAEEWLEKS